MERGWLAPCCHPPLFYGQRLDAFVRLGELEWGEWEDHLPKIRPNTPKSLMYQCNLVPKRGLEPLRFTSLPPQGSASTNSATWATAHVEPIDSLVYSTLTLL